ncbi:MAG: putative low-complexity protein [Sphingobacteriales bacterium]|nr:putative low-complexity protein [Sphingobacteriales bacterium]
MSPKGTIYHSDELFKNYNFPDHFFQHSVFENCTFENYNFSDKDFSGTDFIETLFINCNFSNASLAGSGLKDTIFKHCKLTGVDFARSKDFLFSVQFSNCILDYTSFVKKKNRKCNFIDCSVKGADFTESDLTNSTFDNCDLIAAVFNRTNLNNADLSTSYNFVINPEINSLRKAKLSLNGLPGLLLTYGIVIV